MVKSPVKGRQNNGTQPLQYTLGSCTCNQRVCKKRINETNKYLCISIRMKAFPLPMPSICHCQLMVLFISSSLSFVRKLASVNGDNNPANILANASLLVTYAIMQYSLCFHLPIFVCPCVFIYVCVWSDICCSALEVKVQIKGATPTNNTITSSRLRFCSLFFIRPTIFVSRS